METVSVNFEKYNTIAQDRFFKVKGKVVNVVGLTIESKGPQARLGDICRIYPSIKGGGDNFVQGG